MALVGYFISENFRTSTENRLEDVLTANVFNLMGTVQLDKNGQLTGFPNLGEARYSLFDSGWYWSVQQIGKPENRLTSASLAGQPIIVPSSIGFDETFQRSFEISDESGQMISGLEAQVFLGEGNDLFSFKVTANKSSIDEEIAAFRRTLFITLAVFALSLVLAMLLMVKVGLNPLSRATKMLTGVREGKASRIEGDYPDEIQPLIDETNALIASNTTIVERARTQVGNLAHSLKTPLAVIQNEITSLPPSKKKLVAEQAEAMKRQVQIYLDRARISARSKTAISSTAVLPEIVKLSNVISKLHPECTIATDFDGLENVQFLGETNDLQEVFGNLMENAAKYSQGQIRVKANFENSKIAICIEDDGSGMTEDQIEMALKRGSRVDEGKTGWGLGLSIVGDIVDEYDGTFVLSRSLLGGLKADVSLPGSR